MLLSFAAVIKLIFVLLCGTVFYFDFSGFCWDVYSATQRLLVHMQLLRAPGASASEPDSCAQSFALGDVALRQQYA